MPSAKPLRVSYLTRVLHTTRICNVKGIMCVYSIRKMVNFKLDDEMEKDVFSSRHGCSTELKVFLEEKLFRIHKLPSTYDHHLSEGYFEAFFGMKTFNFSSDLCIL